MSRKHFIAIAANIRKQLDDIDNAPASVEFNKNGKTVERFTVRTTAENLCNVFADANPAFDRSRFLAACGLD